MGGLGGVASSGISAAAQMAMQSQMLDNYWDQIFRQAQMRRNDYALTRMDYQDAYRKYLTSQQDAEERQRFEYQKGLDLAKLAYGEVQDTLKGPQTDIYGGLRTYVPGQGFQYTMAPDVLEDMRQAMRHRSGQIDIGSNIQRNLIPQALAAYAGREQYTPDELFQDYRTQADLADWRARQQAGELLGRASVRGGNRSNWAEKVADYIREDSRDRQLRYADARTRANADALALNRASNDTAFADLQNLFNMSNQGGNQGFQYAQFGDQKSSNASDITTKLASAIGNIDPQLRMHGSIAGSYVPDPMNEVWKIPRPSTYEQSPSLSV